MAAYQWSHDIAACWLDQVKGAFAGSRHNSSGGHGQCIQSRHMLVLRAGSYQVVADKPRNHCPATNGYKTDPNRRLARFLQTESYPHLAQDVLVFKCRASNASLRQASKFEPTNSIHNPPILRPRGATTPSPVGFIACGSAPKGR